VCTTREKETERHTFFLGKNLKKNRHRAEVTCCPVNRFASERGGKIVDYETMKRKLI
jgi:hypothetical protein